MKNIGATKSKVRALITTLLIILAFKESPLPVLVLDVNTKGNTLKTTANMATRTGWKCVRVVAQVDLTTFTFR